MRGSIAMTSTAPGRALACRRHVRGPWGDSTAYYYPFSSTLDSMAHHEAQRLVRLGPDGGIDDLLNFLGQLVLVDVLLSGRHVGDNYTAPEIWFETVEQVCTMQRDAHLLAAPRREGLPLCYPTTDSPRFVLPRSPVHDNIAAVPLLRLPRVEIRSLPVARGMACKHIVFLILYPAFLAIISLYQHCAPLTINFRRIKYLPAV